MCKKKKPTNKLYSFVKSFFMGTTSKYFLLKIISSKPH